ncbi:hypothetical protein [Haloarcula litorea]|uniref:hypothetical protein n=1 Tax=Haloarcula litorea TaxID=3032579 RepID=UPI0023E79790|nr:hypothetical protein [Halomicroarcula sp. GDY20]
MTSRDPSATGGWRSVADEFTRDRHGLALWLGLLCWFGLTWRVGFFIQDSYAVANALVALADGHLYLTELRYSLTVGSQPGLHRVDGLLYGRNYGQVALAVPLVWLLEGLSVAVAPRILLAAVWSGLGLGLVATVSRLPSVDTERTRRVGGLVVALLFVGSVLTATDLPRERLALAALQLSTMAVAAAGCVGLYRLVRLWHGRRVGLAAGAVLGLATPVGFWATIPKRHALVGTLVVWAVYAFAVSRRASGTKARRARAAAYALGGLVAWVHAFEAFFLVTTLGAVDLLTARSTGPRTVAAVGVALLVVATPMLATNYAISGNPVEPPRLLPDAEAGSEVPTPRGGDGGTGGGTDGGATGTPGGGGTEAPASGDTATPGSGDTGPPGGGSDPSLLDSVREAAGPATAIAEESVIEGVGVLGQPERVWHIFVRSGHVPGLRYELNDHAVIDLALLEATPLLGALAVFPVLAGRRVSRSGDELLGTLDPRSWPARRQTDLLVAAVAVVLAVVYLPRLPLFSQLTVRYIHPVVPLAVYGVARLPAVRRAADRRPRSLAAAFLAAVGAALAVVLAGIVGLDLALGEAVQYHALLNLATATVCAVVVTGRSVVPDRVSGRAVPVALALPAGFGTAYVLLAGLVYFRYGSYAFDLVRIVAGTLPGL